MTNTLTFAEFPAEYNGNAVCDKNGCEATARYRSLITSHSGGCMYCYCAKCLYELIGVILNETEAKAGRRMVTIAS